MTIMELKDHVHQCDKAKEAQKPQNNAIVDKSKDGSSVVRSLVASLSKSSETKETIQPKYVCPVCKRANLLREELLRHVENNHPSENAVCPICASQPWGDPNRKTHLFAHLKLRHSFSIESFTDLENDDDYLLRIALEVSKTEQHANHKKEEYKGENSNGTGKSSVLSKSNSDGAGRRITRSQKPGTHEEHATEINDLEDQSKSNKRIKKS